MKIHVTDQDGTLVLLFLCCHPALTPVPRRRESHDQHPGTALPDHQGRPSEDTVLTIETEGPKRTFIELFPQISHVQSHTSVN